jgi:hypothetical protein
MIHLGIVRLRFVRYLKVECEENISALIDF